MTSVADPGKSNRRTVSALVAVAVVVVAMLPLALGASVTAQASPVAAIAQQAKPSCGNLKATIVGTPGDDHLVGTSGADVVVAGMGDDVVVGKGGQDVICGRAGDDVIRAGKGADTLRGGDGDDRLEGGKGHDDLRGGEDDDTLRGNAGDDALDGGPQTDDCEGGSGFNTVTRCEVTTNHAPTAADDTPTTNEDSTLGINVLGNDTDPDGDDLLVTAVQTTGTKGVVTIVGGGTQVRYNPNGQFESLGAGASGSDVFSYSIADGQGGVDAATVTVTVTGLDDPPTAFADASIVAEDSGATTIDVRANDTNPDGGPKTITAVTQPPKGNVAITNGGNDLTYEPDADECNDGSPTDDFTYTLNGGSTATVKVSVSCVNDPGTAVDDSKEVAEDSGATTIDVQANDLDVDGGTITGVTQPANGAVEITGGGDDLSYEPDADYCNNPPGTTTDDFTYTVTGGSTATVAITVDCVDDPPTAVNDSATVGEDSGASPVDVLANDVDVDGGPMTVNSTTEPDHGSVVITGGGSGVTYEPDADYCNSGAGGAPDTFSYTLNGGDSATVSVTVTCVDDPPVAVNDSATVGEDSGASPVDVLANDVDVDGGPMTVNSTTEPDHGSVVITGGGSGVTYEPDADYCNSGAGGAPDTFSYTLNGGDSATVSVTVTCVDDLPVAVNDSATVGEDSGASPVDVLANDVDVDGGPMTVNSTTEPDHGSVVITGGGSGVTYEPDADYCNSGAGGAPDTFSYTLNGGDSATVSVTVTCVDDPPVAVNDSATVGEDSGASPVDVLANDVDVDGGPMTVNSTTEPDHGSVVITGGGSGVTYEPDADYCNSGAGGAPDTFSYTLNGGDSATVSVTVTCVDDLPVAVNDSATVGEDSGASPVDVLANDVDVDGGPMTVNSTTEPDHGSVVITGGGSGVTYEPDADYCNSGAGGAPDTFSYTLNGGDSATVSVTVTCVDDAPVAVDDAAQVTLNDPPTAITVLANDTDVDGGPKTIASASDPAHGTVVLTGGSPGEHTGLTYEPDDEFCDDDTPDTFTYTLTPGGSTATVSVTVACDIPPTAVDDTKTVAEDDPATTIDVLANDTDPDDGPIRVQSVTDPANGAVVITNGGDDLTYEPDDNYCNAPPSTSPDTFTYTLAPGGSTAAVSVSVTCSDDNPVAVDDSATVAEDSAATAVDVLANDTDVDGGPRLITSASDPANGTVVLTGGGTGLTYQPDANYCNSQAGGTPDTFTYTVNGDDTATVSVTVTCVADPPTIDNSAGDTSYTENAPATVVDGNITVTNNDGLTITAASVNITVGFAAGQDVLDWVDNNPADGITEGASTNQTLLLTGNGTAAQYEAALEAVTYRNTSDDPSTAPRTVTFSLATSAGSPSDTKGLTVTSVPDPPTAVNDSATVAEDAVATAIDVLANDTDPDAGPMTISSASVPANGTVVLTGGSAGAHTGLTYQPDPNYCNSQAGGAPDTFTYTMNGGSTATVSVTVTCAPDNPVVDTSAGSTGYTENAAATVIDAGVTVSDVDAGTTITGATVKITGNYAGAEDVLALANPGSHPLITPGVVGDTLTLTGPASVAAYQAALRDVTYRNSSENPSTLPRTITFTVSDETARSGSDTKGITVTAVDDPPTAVNDSATVLEDAAATAVPVLTNDTDPDAGPKTIGSVTQPANGTVAITGGGSGLTYQPNANYCNDPPGTTLSTFTYTLNGGSNATVSMTVTCVNDAPVADDETFNGTSSAVGNTALVVNDPDDQAPTLNAPKKSISGDILAGDTDIDSPTLTVTPGTFATNDGGTVTVEADGDFTYVSDPADACADTSDFFDYIVTDGNTPTAGTDIGRVTIAVTGCVWYVSNNGSGNAGTSTAPFDTLAQAETNALANHTIFVFDGNDTSTGYAAGINLKAGQVLTSEAANLVIGADTLWTGVAANRPTLTDNNADVVDLDDGNTVRGFVIDPQGTGGGIAGTTGDTGPGTIDNVFIQDGGTRGTQPGLELDATTGTFNVSDFTVNNGDANNATGADIGVRLNNAGTVVFAPGSTISVTTQSARALDITGTALGTSTFDDITVTSSGSGGLSLVNTIGTIALGDDGVADISLTTNGAPAAFLLNNAGTVTVGAGGTDSIFATNGPAIDITGAGSFAFDDTDSTTSTTDGINLASFGTGTFSTGTGSAIAGAAGIGFDLDTGSGAVTYDGTITAPAGGRSVDVTGRTGSATVDFNGLVTDNGLGVNVSGNSATSLIRFDGGLIASTGGNTAFNATGGTVVVTDPNANGTAPDNTLTTGTGTALNVSGATIGAGGLLFRSISANAAANGIVLANTGASGSLTVTGSGSTTQGGDFSGGTIQATTGHGISLTNTTAPSFRNVRLLNTGNSGVNGTQVAGFSFVDGTITGAGDASDENSITFDDSLTSTPNLTGAVTITNNVISLTEAEGIDIENWAGTISDATISNNALSDTGDVATPGSAITLIGSGLAASAANITRATVANNTITDFRAGVGVQVRAGNPNVGGPTGSAGTAGNATNVIAVTGNLMNGGSGGVGNQPDRFFTGGVSGNGGQGNFNVSNNGTAANRLRNIDCIAIEMQMDGPVTMTSTVSNNFINANSAVGCAGIAVGTDDPNDLGAGTHSTLISGNNVMGTNGPGIFPIVRDSGSTMFARVLNNTVAAPNATNAARAGIRVDSGSAQGDTTMCLEITGNTTAGSTNTDTGTTSPGINLRKQGTDATVNTFGIEGMAATASPGVENYVNGLNSSTSGTFGTGGTALLSAQSGFTNCNAP